MMKRMVRAVNPMTVKEILGGSAGDSDMDFAFLSSATTPPHKIKPGEKESSL
jgi:hypothetical protein